VKKKTLICRLEDAKSINQTNTATTFKNMHYWTVVATSFNHDTNNFIGQ
jgi:hypothetical protein